jgi:type II secretory pathway component PulC
MRPPLWIINSALLALFGLCVYSMFLLQPKTPQANSLVPKAIVGQNSNVTPVNLKSIYEDDIFKTHISQLEPLADAPNNLQIPLPPTYQPTQETDNDLPNFLEPLPITVTGIMTFGNEEYNRTMIRDNRTQIEKSYLVGDELEDAQIVRILPNKILIIRSNSQQETLFLREQDVIVDLDTIEPNWDDIILAVGTNQYQINVDEFTQQVKTVGNLIDLLNLITAYKAGVSIGVKIGSNTSTPLVEKLGLNNGDVILSMNSVGLANADERLQAYELATQRANSSLVLKVLRAGNEFEIIYDLNYQNRNLANLNHTTNNNSAEIQSVIHKNRSNFELINDSIKAKDRQNIAQFKNKISQSVSG